MEFIELRSFTERMNGRMTASELREMQIYLIEHPDAGALIKGTKGLRKLRWKAAGRGKQGGVRVIYYWFVSENEIYLLDLYAKNERADLTNDQAKELSNLIRRLKEEKR